MGKQAIVKAQKRLKSQVTAFDEIVVADYNLSTFEKLTHEFLHRRVYGQQETNYEPDQNPPIARGAQPDSDGREPWFLCYSLSEQDVADTLTMFEDAVKAAQK